MRGGRDNAVYHPFINGVEAPSEEMSTQDDGWLREENVSHRARALPCTHTPYSERYLSYIICAVHTHKTHISHVRTRPILVSTSRLVRNIAKTLLLAAREGRNAEIGIRSAVHAPNKTCTLYLLSRERYHLRSWAARPLLVALDA